MVDDWNYMIDLYAEEHPDETKDWELTDLYMEPKGMEELVKASIDAYRMADNIVNDLNRFSKYLEDNKLNGKDEFKSVMRDFFKQIGL